MKLIASVIVYNELDRYLRVTAPALLGFCDEVRVLDDGSTDGSGEYLAELGCVVTRNETSMFFQHEGAARQQLLDWTIAGEPTHILAIDADEIITDPEAIHHAARNTLAGGVWTLSMEEVWELDGDCICIRGDGGWHPKPVPILFAVPPYEVRERGNGWGIANRALACGREPVAVRRHAPSAPPTGASVLHFGWANESERQARYERYAVADGGRFHRSAHLDSILWNDDRVMLEGRPWPEALLPLRNDLELIVRYGGRALVPTEFARGLADHVQDRFGGELGRLYALAAEGSWDAVREHLELGLARSECPE